ncbi:MAG: Gfo/Idh/MocA family oxidoreductase [Candidatus Hydrogenedentes bacterium]|nr:Gfo/Idh/MocA family oxidoreductase [Candidatus Hydrogenedentota bacterium]
MNTFRRGQKDFSRRSFLAMSGAALGLPLIVPRRALGADGAPGANDRITVAFIGVGGMGGSHLGDMKRFVDAGAVNIAAVCDVDEKRLKEVVKRAGAGVTPYRDYRYILERKDIDAVVIATPDHWHAVQMVHACQTGKHVYVEKPACCTIDEGTAMMKAAHDNKVAVQVGSQGRSEPEAYLAHRYLANGAIGRIDTVTCFHYASPTDEKGVPDSEPPEELDWDLWLGPLRWRPYNKKYCHGTFRWLMESGGGQIRDRGAHVMSCAMYWMDADGTAPVTVTATGTPPKKGLWDACVDMNVTYTFKDPDWTLTWNQPGNPVPKEDRRNGEPEISRPGYGAVYHGDQGTFVHWGGDGGTWAERTCREWTPPAGAKEVFKSPGHKEDWFNGIRTGSKTIMNIDAAVGVSDLCNLGNLAYLLGRTLEWDGKGRRIVGDEVADRMLARPQRYPYCI